MAATPKYLTKTDVEKRFDVPIEWIDHVLPPFEKGSHELPFAVIDGVGFYWEFCCSIRKTGPYRKPVLQAESWLKFANRKQLQVGDRIILQKEVNSFRGTEFKMSAQKYDKEGQYWFDV